MTGLKLGNNIKTMNAKLNKGNEMKTINAKLNKMTKLIESLKAEVQCYHNELNHLAQALKDEREKDQPNGLTQEEKEAIKDSLSLGGSRVKNQDALHSALNKIFGEGSAPSPDCENSKNVHYVYGSFEAYLVKNYSTDERFRDPSHPRYRGSIFELKDKIKGLFGHGYEDVNIIKTIDLPGNDFFVVRAKDKNTYIVDIREAHDRPICLVAQGTTIQRLLHDTFQQVNSVILRNND